jgi:hypothetical protein
LFRHFNSPRLITRCINIKTIRCCCRCCCRRLPAEAAAAAAAAAAAFYAAVGEAHHHGQQLLGGVGGCGLAAMAVKDAKRGEGSGNCSR